MKIIYASILLLINTAYPKLYLTDDLHWDGTRIDGQIDEDGKVPNEPYPNEHIDAVFVDSAQ